MARNEIAPIPVESGGGGMMLFGTDNPEQVIARATKVAKVLAKVIEDRKLFTMIGQGKHLRLEAWQTLGAMTGVFPIVAWTRKLENGWEARVEAKFRNGDLAGAAECECLNTERNWANKEDHSLRSMAQTRATSKALASALRFIVTLAGYEGTPAEEMPEGGTGSTPPPSSSFRRPQERTGGTEGTKPAAAGPSSSAPVDGGGHKSWTGKIDKVTFREYAKKGADGKPTGEKGKTYSLHTKDGKVFKTWSTTHADDAKYAADSGEQMTITYSESEFRGNVEFKAETVIPAALNEEGQTADEGQEQEA